MIDTFWSWMVQSLNSALSTLNNIVNNDTMRPFWNLFIVVFAFGIIIKFVVMPLLRGGVGASDKARKVKDNEQ